MPKPLPHQVEDVLGAPYLAETLTLEPDDEGEVVATLVIRHSGRPVRKGAPRKAVLYLHGFCDYFFQTGAADFWVGRGYDFYALDLRKFGRSLRPHQTPNYTADLGCYFEELDEAYRLITERDGHDHVVVTGHSTGGLIAALWLDARRHEIAGLVLNSPWLDLNGSFLTRTAGTKAIDQLGSRRPYLAIPRNVSGLYGRSIHKDHSGEWSFDLAWKPLESWPAFIGWLRAIRRGHAAVHKGLDVGAPVLVLTSARSLQPKEWEPSVDSTDIVLDVNLIAKWAHKLGPTVALVKIAGGMHDLTLSREPSRSLFYDEIARWLDAYVDTKRAAPPRG